MMFESLDFLTAEFYAGFIDIVLVKGTAIVLAASVACYMLRRSSASTRHAVWAAAFAALLLLPALTLVGPSPSKTIVGVRAETAVVAASPRAAVGPGVAVGTPRRTSARRSVGAAPLEAAHQPVTTISITRLYRWIVAIWLSGLVALLLRFVADVLAVKRLRAPGPVRADVARRVDELAEEIGLVRSPRVIVSPDVTVPGTFGVLRPKILLPTGCEAWTSDQFDAAVLHELGHMRRRDYVTHVIAALTRAAYWVNPTVLYAARRLDMERERACDDGVVLDRIDPVRYAEYLMKLALGGRTLATQPPLSFATRSSLRERVRSLLDRAQQRAPLSRPKRLLIVGVAGLVLVLAATIEIFGLVQATGDLTDPDPLVRRQAAWALGDREDPADVEALIAQLSDGDPRVRSIAAWALGEIKDSRAIEPLSVLLADDHPVVREMAVLAIGEIEDPAGLDILRGMGPSVASDEVRGWAIDEILLGGQAREVFAGALAGAAPRAADFDRYVTDLSSSDPRTRALAAELLGVLGAPAGVEPLLDALADEDPTVRAAAVWALDEIHAAPGGPNR